MLFNDIKHCSIKDCSEHECKYKLRFRYQCDADRCDLCTAGYNCIRCRKYETCQDGHRNADIQRVRRHQLNEMYKNAPKTSPVIHIQDGFIR